VQYLRSVMDHASHVYGWQQVGTWTVPEPTYAISGQVTTGSSVAFPGVTINVNGVAAGSTGSAGSYSINEAAGGNYTVTAFYSGCTFTPPSYTYNPLSGNQTANFAAQCSLTTTVNPPGAGTINPGSGTYGGTVQVSASPNAGYQFTGFSGDLSGGSPQSLNMVGPKSVTANFAQQYYLTTSVNPPGAGSITPASGWYSSGSPIAVQAYSASGYQFAGFTGALTGMTNPQNFTITATATITANFVPTVWKGINYSPRRHEYWRMLYDWYTWDSTAGKYVYQMADEDMARLAQNGFNVLHLYLWDNLLLNWANPNKNFIEYAGFPSSYHDPRLPGSYLTDPTCPTCSWGQWKALSDFVGHAESHGLFVTLHFANRTFMESLGGNPHDVALSFSNWAAIFMDYLRNGDPNLPANPHRNVLMWGLPWSFQPDAIDRTGTWNLTWQYTYYFLDQAARLYSPAPGVLGLIGADIGWHLVDSNGNPVDDYQNIIARGSRYLWFWQGEQQVAKVMRDLLTSTPLGGQGSQPPYNCSPDPFVNQCGGLLYKDPDLYLVQLYSPNSSDLLYSLNATTSCTLGCDPNGIPVAPSKIFVVEFATSSSLSSVPNGNGIPWFGDANTPTTTISGQAQWLSNTLCAFKDAGIEKFAYWSMYDPWEVWADFPWLKSGTDLAWNGYWGLSYDEEWYGDKPAWQVLSSFYSSYPGGLTCSGSPVVSLVPSASYYTVSQPVRVTWTAANAASLCLNFPHGVTYSCNLQQEQEPIVLSTNDLTGSCAQTDIQAFSSTGNPTITVSGFSDASCTGSSQSASAMVTIGAAPIVNEVYAQPTVLSIYGQGFSNEGHNQVKLTRSGYADVLISEGGSYSQYDNYNFINVQVPDGTLPGQWTLYVCNGHQDCGNPANWSNPATTFLP
jgi:hypothetical protein